MSFRGGGPKRACDGRFLMRGLSTCRRLHSSGHGGAPSVLRSEKFVNLSGNTGNAFEKPDGRDRITNHPTKEGGAMAKTARKSRAKAKTTRTRKAGKRGSATKRKTAPARRKTATRRGKSLPVKKV